MRVYIAKWRRSLHGAITLVPSPLSPPPLSSSLPPPPLSLSLSPPPSLRPLIVPIPLN